MNILVTHGWAYRLRNDGIIETAKTAVMDDAILLEDWLPRSMEELDMTGGDIAEIETWLKRFGLLFQDDSRRLPSNEGMPKGVLQGSQIQ